MAKVYFRYAAINAGKSTQLLQVRYNYHERGQKTLLLKPKLDNRDSEEYIKPRIGSIQAKVDHLIKDDTNIFDLFKAEDEKIDCVIVDEVQFLSREQIIQLCKIADYQNVPVICYGLRADFRGELFPGSAALLALADDIEELKTICWCGKKATINARVIDGNIITDGPQILIGGNESYTSVCRKHWMLNKLKK